LELARRDKVAKAKAFGVKLPATLHRPTADPTATADASPRPTAAAPAAAPATPISVEGVMAEVRARAAAEVEAGGGLRPPEDPDEVDEELIALEASCVEVYTAPKVVLPPQRLDPNDPIVRLKDEVGPA